MKKGDRIKLLDNDHIDLCVKGLLGTVLVTDHEGANIYLDDFPTVTGLYFYFYEMELSE
jgi:hypothetical protein